MSDPWWFSGSDQLGEQDREQDREPEVGGDWLSMLSGAQRMVAWAAEAFVAPHAGHDDPHEHPHCLICRGMAFLGESGLGAGLGGGLGAGLGARMEGAASEMGGLPPDAMPEPAPPITWLTINR